MTNAIERTDPWGADSLDYLEYGKTFTNLVKSIKSSKVISIEAGFGNGKTFFRKAWAQHLRESGELAIEIDAQQSDHSGDPIITFLGALIEATPKSGQQISKEIREKSFRIASLASRAVVRALLKNGADEIIEATAEWLNEQAPDTEFLNKTIGELEAGMSRAAGQMLAAHLAAERARREEFPEQIDRLRDALTAGAESKRIIIIIDELDRCHPEYAISLMEAMKLVFGRDGFVFFLMVNPKYLESIAHHRFGVKELDELYLEKFVDFRLSLNPSSLKQGVAAKSLIESLFIHTPFGDDPAFSSEAAGNVAMKIVEQSDLSFRQVKRTVERIDLALRCYRDQPIDLPLLVYLAFSRIALTSDGRRQFEPRILPRAELTPQKSESFSELIKSGGKAEYQCQDFIDKNCRELMNLDSDRYALDPPANGGEYYDWYKVIKGLGPHYIPTHNSILDGVHAITAEPL